MNSIAAYRKENLIRTDSPVVRDLSKMIQSDSIQVIMSDRNMHFNDSEREILVYGQGSEVQPVAFGVLSEVPAWVRIWSGSCIVDDSYLDRDSNKVVLTALAERIKVIRQEKATLLLCELPRRTDLVRESGFSSDVPGQSLISLLHAGSHISISNNYSEPPKVIDCPIFLNLDVNSATRLGIEGFQGFYNKKADRAVITDGTFFVVSQGKGNRFSRRESSVSVYMRTPRLHLPGFWLSESTRKSLVNKCSGEVASKVHFGLKSAIEEQIRKVGSNHI